MGKYLHPYLTAAIACILLIAGIQWYHSSSHEAALDNTSQLPTKESIAALSDEGALASFDKHPSNALFDIVIQDQEGHIVYWNSDTYEPQTYTRTQEVITTNGLTAYFKPKQNRLLPDNEDNRLSSLNKSHSTVWAWLSLLLLVIFTFLSVTCVNRLQINLALKTTLVLLFLAISWLKSKYTTLPTIVNTRDSLINPITAVLIGIGFTFVSNLINQSKRSPFLFCAWNGLSISLLFQGITYYIQSIVKANKSFSIDNTIQYSSDGILFLASICILNIIVFYNTSKAYHTCKHISTSRSSSYYILPLIIGVLGSIIIHYLLGLDVGILVFLAFVIAYVLILDMYTDLKAKSSAFLFVWMIIFAGFDAAILFHTQLSHDIDYRTHLSQNLLHEYDDEALANIKSLDLAIRSSQVIKRLSELPFPAKLDKNDFTTFLKEEIDFPLTRELLLDCFDNNGKTVFSGGYTNEIQVNKSINESERLSDYIYFNTYTGDFYLKYKIENSLFLSSPLTLIIELTDGQQPQLHIPYMVVRNDKLLKLNYDNTIPPFTLSELPAKVGSSIHKRYSITHTLEARDTHVYTFRKMDGLLKPLSLFSFLILMMGLLLVLFGMVNAKLQIIDIGFDLNPKTNSSLKSKMQYTIIALTLFSFILIGLMTIFYFRNVINTTKAKDQSSMVSTISNHINDITSIAESSEGNKNILIGHLSKLSHIYGMPLSFYDAKGQLISSTLKAVEVRVPYTYANTPSYAKELYTPIGTNIYAPLINRVNTQYGILRIHDTNTILKNDLLGFLSTILNVYVFLFFVAGAVAIAIGNSITRPLFSLSNRLQQFKLGNTHDPIEWNTKDEIGLLISNFNDMATKLEESANIIAKTERDTAWKEMAKQVAHEIKNPLTPMKLSIQHLQRLAESDRPDLNEMVSRISKTLLEQFNNLNNIANSFSNFASMPQADNEKIIVNEIVESVHDLFRKREDMDITLSEPINDLYIYADRNQLVRVLNNIVKNAIQSIPTDRRGSINISLYQKEKNAVIKVSDNGGGIPEDMWDKVFTPNFTTKSSGTGLGLAISLNMVEAWNGKIYFETKSNEGTDFYVEIPLMRLKEHFEENRVSL